VRADDHSFDRLHLEGLGGLVRYVNRVQLATEHGLEKRQLLALLELALLQARALELNLVESVSEGKVPLVLFKAIVLQTCDLDLLFRVSLESHASDGLEYLLLCVGLRVADEGIPDLVEVAGLHHSKALPKENLLVFSERVHRI